MRLKKFDQLNEQINLDNSRKTTIDDWYIKEKNLNGIEVEWLDVDKCTIYWDYELIVKQYGIDSIMPSIQKIVLDIKYYVFNEDKDFEDEFEKTFEYDIMNADIETENEDGTASIPYSPNEIDISHLEVSEDNKPKIKITF